MLFLHSLIILLTLDLFLCATLKGWKKSIGFSDAERYAESFKKRIKKINILEARQTLKILSVAISSDIIYFRFLPISGHLWTTQENQNWSIQSGRISCNFRKKFLIISKEKIFRVNRKESLLISWCLQHYFGDLGDSYISSSSLFYFSFVTMWSQPASIAWTVTSTAVFYHCWNYTKHYDLWIRCVVYIWY